MCVVPIRPFPWAFNNKFVSSVFNPAYRVYAVKGITPIPLIEERARSAVNTLGSRNDALRRPSLGHITIPGSVDSSVEAETGSALEEKANGSLTASAPAQDSRTVKFAPELEVNILSPNPEHGEISRPPSPSESEVSVDSSEHSNAATPIAQVLASKLSFWSHLSKRTTSASPSSTNQKEVPVTPAEEKKLLDDIMEEGKQSPDSVLNSILATTAPPPDSVEERHTELEDKIVRECIREFTKGGMYFAYTFGAHSYQTLRFFAPCQHLSDITRSLQHKQELVANCSADPNILDQATPRSHVDAFAEPNPTLPLSRRVDRHFWWNEWLTRRFIEAGVQILSVVIFLLN